ncbi:Peptide deformylase 2 [Providencia rustigianii]|uniref:Peptide deformylase n=1 Tax=Providencia rustigianii DSM 4541 TaxID=500637 RepID=D1NZH1_9GAMM|nr:MULTISPECIES: peptide deformylase [Providencia]EFB73237.1 peptide deformylase [Providencia rustigianii DSM 4541]MTC57117.1 peptide deformylase [Providencia rustigianii]SPY77231.1 Peptide deformylase 2 [Providencia rustigianii]SUC26590.1 Peptide deformylase 2 [Providencia rustigianii]VEB68607.1 Peptide deformylase 2 [Providencia rustigianii]
MAVREIIEIPDERLRIKCAPVTDFAAVQTLIDDLIETMYSTDTGIGLAAPQIAETKAIMVIDISEERNQPMVFINPEIIESEGETSYQEGCLSVPDVYADVPRFQRVKVKAFDRDGNEFIVDSDEFLAIVMQHEIDHLNGKVFIDHLSTLKRNMLLKKLKKQQRLKQQ